MFFEDLALCDYHTGPYDSCVWSVPLRAVGWLEHPNSYPKGEAESELIKRLEKCCADSLEHYPSFAFRGVHNCSLCRFGDKAGPRSVPSHVNIWIPGERVVYIAPALIVHYIGDHGYRPPDEFKAAVICCPEYGSAAYCDALQAANLGSPVPLKTKDQVDAEFEAMRLRATSRRSGK